MLLWATLLIVVAPLFFTNCSNDPEMDAVPPVFKEVVINPTSVQAGKSVNATLKIQSMGKSCIKSNTFGRLSTTPRIQFTP